MCSRHGGTFAVFSGGISATPEIKGK